MGKLNSPYDLITIKTKDIIQFEDGNKQSRIWILLKLVLDEMPQKLAKYRDFIDPYLVPIEGFEDRKVCGYEVKIDENEKVEFFVKQYIPFFILIKE